MPASFMNEFDRVVQRCVSVGRDQLGIFCDSALYIPLFFLSLQS